MAKLKYEFEHEYYKTHRRPVSDYLFGNFQLVAGLAAKFAPLANWVTGNKLLHRTLARLMGITEHRQFPKFSNKFAKPVLRGKRPRVIFLRDAFSHFIEPQVEQAAFDVLDRIGFDVVLLPWIGSGALLLSKAFIEPARKFASRVLDAIKRIDPENALPIVGIEPPEIYTLKNDYVDLLPGRVEEIKARASHAWLLDEFLVRTPNFVSVPPRVSGPQNILFQPHCHQRAEGLAADGLPTGQNATVAALRMCGYTVEVSDAGCCGMAGTFGYEAEHYELSQQVGALKLFPQLRARPDALVAATGAACRLQIEQGTQVAARHSVLLIAAATSK
jgi:Fe-S oxidoreductase